MRRVVETPVLIVGGGPIGFAVALDLAYHGHRSVLIEQDAGTGLEILAKAGGLNARTLEHCRRWGIADRVANWGADPDYPRDTVFCTSLQGEYVGRDPLPAIGEIGELPYSPEIPRKCPQYIFDPLIARAVLEQGRTEVLYSTRFERLEQDDNGVTAHVRDLKTDEPYVIRAAYVVACDGAASVVRRALQIPFDGKMLGYSVSTMLRIKNLERYHPWGKANRFMFIGKDGTWANITSVDFRDLWRFTKVGLRDKPDVSELDAQAEIRAAIGEETPFEIVRTMPWRRSECTAKAFQVGRVLLAGDAAHTTSPTGGHGLNTGMGDAAGMGWMLDALLSGWGGPGLLDAYEAERRPVAMRNSSNSTTNYLNWSVGADYSKILDHGPEGVEARQRIGEHLLTVLHMEWNSVGIAMGYRYEKSPIIVSDGTESPKDSPSEYVQTARPGHRAPHAWLDDGRSTLDLFGHGFVLLRFDSTVNVDPLEAAAARTGVPLTVVTIQDQSIAALYERHLCLVRPDGHSAWRGDALPENVDQLIDTVRGAAPKMAQSPSTAAEVSSFS